MFLSYRRLDDPHFVGRLREALAQQFDVFFDVDSIGAGEDLRQVIRAHIRRADVVLVVIGAHWGIERLADEGDYVRLEMVEALDQQKPLIPVLVGTASMPVATDFPDELAALAYLCAAAVRPEPDFRTDVGRLLADVDRLAAATRDFARQGAAVVRSEARPTERATPQAGPVDAAASAWPASPDSSARRPLRVSKATRQWRLLGAACLCALVVALVVVVSQRSSRPRAAPADDPVLTDDLPTLEGHSGAVTSVAWAPDSSQVLTGSEDGTVRVWRSDTGELVGEPLEGHGHWVLGVAWSRNGRVIASGGWDGTIHFRDAETRQPARLPITIGDGNVLCIALSPRGDRVAAGSSDTSARVWDVATGAEIGGPLHEHTDAVLSVAWSPDGSKLASASWDNTVQIRDVASGKIDGAPLAGHKAGVRSVAWSPDGTRLLTGSEDGSARIWDVTSRQQLGRLVGHEGPVRSVAWSPDSRKVLTGGEDATARVWDAASQAQLGDALVGHLRPIRSVAWSPDGTSLLTGSDDGTARLWPAR